MEDILAESPDFKFHCNENLTLIKNVIEGDGRKTRATKRKCGSWHVMTYSVF